ncbi:MAG TPA: alpha/beta hydrolase-fold protein, partial [Pyrinomonadaceae bacterium]|nr:alpha/beta hydrolase-fold protein [Pyrinomonadaceae bacterium]
MFRNRISFAALFAILLFTAIHAQPQQVASVVHTRYTISSTALGEDRTILVRVPTGYERSTQRFPVVVMLDAHPPQNAVMASIIEDQANAGRMPEMILVGIQNTDRTRDLTPTKTERENTGGGDKFLDFIQNEVLPFVEKNYRTQPYRVFAGHSLGGLTVVYTMISRPDLFNGYIAASPVLHWDKNFPINKSAEVFKTRKDWKKTLFIALGNEPDYDAGFNLYKDLLKKADLKDFSYEFQHWMDEDHGSIVHRAYLAGMRKIFEGWQPQIPVTGVAALEDHYAKLTKRFG